MKAKPVKSDLDRLMAENNLDALLVMGDSGGNTVMNYLTGGHPLEGALIVKRRDGPMTLIHGSMERDTAAQTGMELVDRDVHYNRYSLLETHGGDRLAAQVDFFQQVIRDQKLQGRLGIYGQDDPGATYVLLSKLQSELTDTELVGEFGQSIFTLARQTKDSAELAELAEAGRLTCRVVGEVQNFIQQHNVEDDVVVKSDGSALTVGDVKAFMQERLRAVGLEDHGHTIFSLGREAAVPHNRGSADTPLRLGHTIIFDIFPQNGRGYYHDMTRTWCLGYAPPEVYEAWHQVKEIFDRVMANFRVGTSTRDLQMMTCDYLESKGHPTVRSQPGTHEGYVHSLGHGIGLDIHEGPNLTSSAGYDQPLAPGHVITVEPGVYYPDRGFGVRIEDAVAINEAGELVWLTDYPYDLVIPMQSAESSEKLAADPAG